MIPPRDIEDWGILGCFAIAAGLVASGALKWLELIGFFSSWIGQ